MGDKVALKVEERLIQGKKVKKLRKDGFVPAVIYGNDLEAQSIMAPHVEITKAFRSAGKHQPIELHMGTKKHLVMIKTVDVDPVKHQLRHVAFHAIKQNEKVQTTVPIIIEGAGETPAEKAGLVVLTTVDSVELEALPKNLPESVVVSGEKLSEINDHLTVANIQVPEGVVILSDPEQVIATVYEPSALQAANEAVGGDAESESIETNEANHGEDTEQEPQASEDQPGGKKQFQSAKD